MYTKLPISVYFSSSDTICLVPSTRFDGVNLDADGQPKSVRYITNNYYIPIKYYSTLKGLNISDLGVFKPDFIYYYIAEGQYLVVDKEAIAKAIQGRNNASSKGEHCLIHQVSDLRLATELPEQTMSLIAMILAKP